MRAIFMSDGESLYMTTTFDEVWNSLSDGLHVATPEEHIVLIDDEYISLDENEIIH